MKKNILKFVLIVLLIILLIKIYHLAMLNKIYKSIENFKLENNRCYKVEMFINSSLKMVEELYLKESITYFFQSKDRYAIWRNLETNDCYEVNCNDKEIYKRYSNEELSNMLPHIPHLILMLYENNKLNLGDLLKVYYIVPITYDGNLCYKITTKFETIIINSKTYLPVCAKVKVANLENNDLNYIVEYTYNFEVGNVTDEDVSLPDLTDYKILGN